MAYALRPDGLADVEVAPGRVIPMPVAVAQQAGHEERPSLFDPARGALAFTGDTPLNEGANGSGAVGNVPDVKPSLAPAPAPPRDVGSGGSGGRGSEDGDQGRQGTDSQGAGAPTPTAPKSAAPAEPRVKVGEVPDPDQAAMAARQSRGRGGGRIVQLSKGGDIRSSFTRVPGQEITDEQRNLLLGDPYSEQAQQAAEAAGMTPEQVFLSQSAGTIVPDTYEANAANVAGLMQKQADLKQAEHAAMLGAIAREEDRRKTVDKKIREFEAARAQRDAEANKLTPQSAKEVWASKSTFAQIGAAIQMALGGYLQGLQGRANNPGYDMVMQGITQEVADQRARYEAAIAKGERARGDYAEAIAMYGTPEAAALDIENRRLLAALKLGEKTALEIGTAEYKNASALLAQDLRTQIGDRSLKISQIERDHIVEQHQYIPPQYAQIGGPLKPEARQRQVFYRGKRFFVPSGGETRVKALGERLAALSAVDASMAELETLVSQASTVSPQFADELKQQIDAQILNVGTDLNTATGQGAMAEFEAEGIRRKLGKANELVNLEKGNGIARVQSTRKHMARQAEFLLRANTTVDPEGEYQVTPQDIPQQFETDTGGQ